MDCAAGEKKKQLGWYVDFERGKGLPVKCKDFEAREFLGNRK